MPSQAFGTMPELFSTSHISDIKSLSIAFWLRWSPSSVIVGINETAGRSALVASPAILSNSLPWGLVKHFWIVSTSARLYSRAHCEEYLIIQNENHIIWKFAQTHPLEWFLRIIVITYHACDHAKLRIGIIMNRLDNAAVNGVRFTFALAMLTLEAQWAYIVCELR